MEKRKKKLNAPSVKRPRLRISDDESDNNEEPSKKGFVGQMSNDDEVVSLAESANNTRMTVSSNSSDEDCNDDYNFSDRDGTVSCVDDDDDDDSRSADSSNNNYLDNNSDDDDGGGGADSSDNNYLDNDSDDDDDSSRDSRGNNYLDNNNNDDDDSRSADSSDNNYLDNNSDDDDDDGGGGADSSDNNYLDNDSDDDDDSSRDSRGNNYLDNNNNDDDDSRSADSSDNNYLDNNSGDDDDGDSADSSDNNSDNDSNSSGSSTSDNNDHEEFKNKLKVWAIRRRVPQSHLDDILELLRQNLQVNVPKSSKTFLDTTKAKYIIEPMDDHSGPPGEYTYIGIEQGLKNCVNIDAHETDTLQLQFHCDGLALSRSSMLGMWPLLCRVHSNLVYYEPFVVHVYCGRSKPKNESDYFAKYLFEINRLLENGVTISGRHFNINIHCFIADTPARAFIKNISGHAGFFSCERCRVEGVTRNNHRVFLDKDAEPRTDETFRSNNEPHHRVGATSLCFITPRINMISMFVLDFMHLGFMGIMNKLLEFWFSTGSKFKVSVIFKEKVSDRLKVFQQQVPREFARKTRDLLDFSKYKATELKFFALYAGPVLLKDILSERQYKHFIMFHHASRLLWCPKTALDNVATARHLFRCCFDNFILEYGESSASMNIHNLLHVADDVENIQCSLSEINAFSFENFLGKIKRLLRSPARKTAQLSRRLYEESTLNIKPALITEEKIIKENHNGIQEIQYKGKILSIKRPNNMIILKNRNIIEINRIFHINKKVFVRGVQWNIRDYIYDFEFMRSSSHDSWELQNRPQENFITCSLDDIENKMVRFDFKYSEDTPMRVFVFSLLHQ